jgi:hypothetical protein
MMKGFNERRKKELEASYAAFADGHFDVPSKFAGIHVVKMWSVETGKEHAWKTRVH